MGIFDFLGSWFNDHNTPVGGLSSNRPGFTARSAARVGFGPTTPIVPVPKDPGLPNYGTYPTSPPKFSDARDSYYNPPPSSAAPVAEAPTTNPMYDTLAKMIAALGGGSGAYNTKAATSGINSAYAPGFDALTKERGANAAKNKSDMAQVKNLYALLSGSYTKAGTDARNIYTQQTGVDDSRYAKGKADVNARYDKQIADMTAELTRLGQGQAVQTETDKLNQKRNSVLDNLLQGNTAADTASNQRGNTQRDFYNAGAQGAKLQGADKQTDLIAALNNRYGQIDNSWNQMLAARAGDLSKMSQSAAASRQSAQQAQLNAMFQLANLQRNDAVAGNNINKQAAPKTLSQSDLNSMNIYQRAQNYASNLPTNTAKRVLDLFEGFVGSDDDMKNGQYIPAGSDKPVRMGVSMALSKVNAWAAANNITSQEKGLLRNAVIASYK